LISFLTCFGSAFARNPKDEAGWGDAMNKLIESQIAAGEGFLKTVEEK